jgi:hypothetical protein
VHELQQPWHQSQGGERIVQPHRPHVGESVGLAEGFGAPTGGVEGGQPVVVAVGEQVDNEIFPTLKVPVPTLECAGTTEVSHATHPGRGRC